MKMNKMTSYAIRVVIRMATEDQIMTSKELMDLEQIPQGVLMKILRVLRDNGIVDAHQGRGGLGGGFSLVDSSKDISVYQLVMIMEGEVKMYPEIEKDFYQNEKKKLYNALEEINQEWVLKLKRVKISDFTE